MGDNLADDLVGDAELDEIRAILGRRHGPRANVVIVVDDYKPGESVTVYTMSCCARHKKDLYEEAIGAVEEQLAELEKACSADTMPPESEMH